MTAPDPALIAHLVRLFGPRPAAVLEELAWYARSARTRRFGFAAAIKAAALRRAYPYETALLDAEAEGDAPPAAAPPRQRVLEDEARRIEAEAAARLAEAARLQARAAALRQAAAILAQG